MFDTDLLKYVNDNYGHAEGDKIIRSVATILDECFRDNDIMARIGGDKFVAVLQGINSEGAEIIKNRIMLQIETHNRSRQDDHLKISFSIGYAIGDITEDTLEIVMKNADQQMYIDKASKRG